MTEPRDHLDALFETLRAPPRSLRVATRLPPTVPPPPPGTAPPPTDPETFLHAEHGVTDASPRHAVARCRWCGGPFVLMYAMQWNRHAMFTIEAPVPGRSPWYYVPLPLQVDIETIGLSKWKHLLVAGAAGTAKSHGARHLLYALCRKISGLRVLLLRASYDSLTKNHLQYMEIEAAHVGGIYTGGNIRQMRFPHPDGPDSIMFAGYCANEADIPQHVGPEWDVAFIDEAVLLLPKAINEIISRARGSSTAMEAKVRLGMSPRWAHSILNSNPGGRAMGYLVDMYIRRAPDPIKYPTYNPAVFGTLSSTLDDNPYLDPEFEADNLRHLDASRYRQLRYGDWTAIAGQFFNFTDAHVIRA
jgi:hypothetical protein